MGWLIMISLIIISILRIVIFKAMDIARVFDVTVEELFTFTDQGK